MNVIVVTKKTFNRMFVAEGETQMSLINFQKTN